MTEVRIPLHDFSVDDSSSIPFKLIPLEFRSDYDISVPHRHNYYEIFLFENGGGTHRVDFTTHEITNHSLHFVSPGQVHLVKRIPASNGNIILFSREFYYMDSADRNLLFEMPFLNNNTDVPVIELTPADYEKLNTLILMMYAEEKSGTEMKHEAMRSLLNLFLVTSKRLFVNEEKLSASTSGFYEFKSLVEHNFRTWHKVQDYAQALHISEKQLGELVKKSCGQTVLAVIHDRILLEAKRLLVHGDSSTKEIGYFLNFEDPSHFTKFFKNGSGSTPQAFREQGRKIYYDL
ncbi:MAG: helix-turn-helix domain-containing protein [Flavobacteriales bacterium]